ncbi:MAG TPA: DUF3152 domain-containing protein [Frankiaceae bacterium]|jgi:hypothetical protein|nr:DUF3152 domain-containing protein [Frankiaceae bacterium]
MRRGVVLTRRGKLLLRGLPLFLVLTSSVSVLSHRLDDRAAGARLVSAPSPAPSTGPTRPPGPTGSATPSPSASPAPSVTPSPTARPTRSPSAYANGTGDLVVVPGTSGVHGTGRVRRFTVEVERGLAVDPAAFAAAVETVLFDARGWAGTMAFQRVSSGPVAFRVTLAAPRTTDRLCRPLDTGGIYSCWNGARAVLNAMRWIDGAASYRGDLASYRVYMVNHEVGHGLGRGHRMSCGPGGLAPVMMQQTKSLYGCRRNPWPLPGEH